MTVPRALHPHPTGYGYRDPIGLGAWREEQERGTYWQRDEALVPLLAHTSLPALPCDGWTLREVCEHGRAEAIR